MSDTGNTPKYREFIRNIFYEACAIFLWAYMTLKIAIFDLDSYLINKFIPSFQFLLDFKLFILLAVISLLWLILGKKEFPKFAAYILAYPIIIIVWKIPKLLFRNWSAAIVFSPAIFEIFTTLRALFISYTLVLLAAICILTTSNKYSLVLSMLILLALLVLHLYASFKKAYKSTVFSKVSNVISSLKSKLTDSSFLQNILDKTETSKEADSEQKNFHSKLSTLYMFHWGVEFVTDKIREVARSRKMDLYLILSWFWTVIFTSVIFSFEYYALYKINTKEFIVTFKPNYLSFLGLSFGKLTPSSVSTILPNDIYSTTLCYAELACSVIIIVILVFTILTAARERYKEDIEKILTEMNEIAFVLQDSSLRLFNLALVDAEMLLVNNNIGLVNGLRKLRGMPELSAQIEPPKEEGSVESVQINNPEQPNA